MWRKTEAYRQQFSGGDNASVDFSVDPEMYTKLGIRKMKKGEENLGDLQKVYEFQLEKDLKKIEARKGPYKKRADLFITIRETDPEYLAIAKPSMLGSDGDFREILGHTQTKSWQSTSQPYGVIAHKRYLEYLANLPKGPTLDEIQDRKQRATDRELWQQIITGKTEVTKKELRRRQRKKLFQAELEDEDIDPVELAKLVKRKERLLALQENRFEELRRRPTEREHLASMDHWHKGVYYPYNFDKGFPVVVRSRMGSVQEEKRVAPNCRPVSAPITSERIVGGSYGQEKRYAEHLAQINFDDATGFLNRERQRDEKKLIKEEERRKKEQMMTRRRGQLGVAISSSVIDAKWQQAKDKYYVSLEVQKEGMQEDGGEGGVVLKQGGDSDDDSSSSSSSSSGDEDDDDEEKKDDAEHPTASGGANSPPKGILRPSSAQASSLQQRARSWSSGLPSLPAVASYLQRSLSGLNPRALQRGSSGSSGVKWKDDGAADGVNASPYVKPAPSAEQRAVAVGSRMSFWAMRESVADWYEDSRLKKGLAAMGKAIRDYAEDDREYETPTQRYKNDAKRKLKTLRQELHSKEATEAMLDLRPDEMSTDDLAAFLKRKRKELRKEIAEIRDKEEAARKPSDYEHIEMLKKRLEYCDALEEDRWQKEKKAELVQDAAESVLTMREEDILAMQEGWQERAVKRTVDRWKRFKRSSLAFLRTVHKSKSAVVRLLPPPSLDNYKNEMNELLAQRIRERLFEDKLGRRMGWIIGREPILDDQEFTLDDLIVAVSAGNYREVLDIIDPRMDLEDEYKTCRLVNAVNHDTLTPLYAALLMVIKRMVLEDTIDMEDWNLSRYNRFRKRIRHTILGRKDWKAPRFDLVIMILLHYGGNLNFARGDFGQDAETLLHIASKRGAVDVVEWILQQGVDCNQLTTRDSRIPLMIAVERNHLDVAMVLLRYGAVIAVDFQDINGNTVMHYAARYGSLRLTQVLLMCGATTQKRNTAAKLPAEEAQQCNRIEIMTTIQSYRDGKKDHLLRMDFLKAMNAEHHGETSGYDPLHGGDSAELSIDTTWDTVRPKHGHTIMTTSEKRINSIWKPYLKGSKIKPLVNAPPEVSTRATSPPVDGQTVPQSAFSDNTTSSRSEAFVSAPRMRRTMLQVSFARK